MTLIEILIFVIIISIFVAKQIYYRYVMSLLAHNSAHI